MQIPSQLVELAHLLEGGFNCGFGRFDHFGNPLHVLRDAGAGFALFACRMGHVAGLVERGRGPGADLA